MGYKAERVAEEIKGMDRRRDRFVDIFIVDTIFEIYSKSCYTVAIITMRGKRVWLQIGYKNPENTEKINIFRKYDSRRPRKHAICHTRFSLGAFLHAK